MRVVAIRRAVHCKAVMNTLLSLAMAVFTAALVVVDPAEGVGLWW